ncbi:MAG: glycosyltransferase family 2 protein [Chloroflexi bacterium]|nr:glycosyltransferase family 2 protein [Chloroflexota bacterium]
MKSEYPGIAIIILNWNSWRDTLECLETVLKSDYPNFRVILIDNASADNSYVHIYRWCTGQPDEPINSQFPDLIYPLVNKPLDICIGKILNRKYSLNSDIGNSRILLMENDENSGFAVANNIGIRVACEQFNPDFYVLLNNDTVIRPNTISELVRHAIDNPDFAALQSAIYKYDQPGQIANAGGTILPWGQTKYYKSIQSGTLHPITFINGCALCLPRKSIEKFGQLTEQFFFGEEDFEFSMRMKRAGQKMGCVADSKVFHKIGISSHLYLDKKIEKKVLLFALNRIVDMKNFYSHWIWLIWRLFFILYFFYLYRVRYRVSLKSTLYLLGLIYSWSGKMNDVHKDTVEPILHQAGL